MSRTLILILALVALFAGDAAFAKAPNQGPNGENCIKTGTERREGKDADTGEKLDCLWDYCTYYKQIGNNAKPVKVTSYSNARDCKPVKASRPVFRLQLRSNQLRLAR